MNFSFKFLNGAILQLLEESTSCCWMNLKYCKHTFLEGIIYSCNCLFHKKIVVFSFVTLSPILPDWNSTYFNIKLRKSKKPMLEIISCSTKKGNNKWKFVILFPEYPCLSLFHLQQNESFFFLLLIKLLFILTRCCLLFNNNNNIEEHHNGMKSEREWIKCKERMPPIQLTHHVCCYQH